LTAADRAHHRGPYEDLLPLANILSCVDTLHRHGYATGPIRALATDRVSTKFHGFKTLRAGYASNYAPGRELASSTGYLNLPILDEPSSSTQGTDDARIPNPQSSARRALASLGLASNEHFLQGIGLGMFDGGDNIVDAVMLHLKSFESHALATEKNPPPPPPHHHHHHPTPDDHRRDSTTTSDDEGGPSDGNVSLWVDWIDSFLKEVGSWPGATSRLICAVVLGSDPEQPPGILQKTILRSSALREQSKKKDQGEGERPGRQCRLEPGLSRSGRLKERLSTWRPKQSHRILGGHEVPQFSSLLVRGDDEENDQVVQQQEPHSVESWPFPPPLVLIHRLLGVIRIDQARSCRLDEIIDRGGYGCILAERWLHEIAYKLGCAYKFGA